MGVTVAAMGVTMGHAKSRLRELTDPDGRHYLIREDRAPGRSYGRAFSLMFMDVLDEVSLLSGTQIKVLVRLVKHLDWKTFRSLPREKLAEELSLSGGAVSTALIALQKAGMVERKGTGPYTQWRLALKLGWRGTTSAYHKARRDREDHKHPRLRVVASNVPSEMPPAA